MPVDASTRRLVRQRAGNRCDYCRCHQDTLPLKTLASYAGNAPQTADLLVESAARLSAEVRGLRCVLAEIREDFSWLTRNVLPIQRVEHIHVRRMARDITSDDWAARLVIDRFDLPETAQASPSESDSLDELARHLTATFESVRKRFLTPFVDPLTPFVDPPSLGNGS